MEVPALIQVLVSIIALLVPSTGLCGFWIWARASILKVSNEQIALKATFTATIEAITTRFCMMDNRCAERAKQATETEKDIKSLIKEVRENDTKTARAVSELTGTVQTFIKGLDK